MTTRVPLLHGISLLTNAPVLSERDGSLVTLKRLISEVNGGLYVLRNASVPKVESSKRKDA